MELTAEKREETGKKAGKIRENGFIPAVLYGPGIKNINLKVKMKSFSQAYKEAGKSSVVSLTIGKEKYDVFVHSLDFDPLTDEVIHIDFYLPPKGKETEIEVPLAFRGAEDIQKKTGGNLIKEIQSVEVKGMVDKLPKEIRVDLSKLEKIGDKITVGDLVVPKEIKILKESEDVVALIVSQGKEEEKVKEVKEEQPIESEREGEVNKKAGQEGGK